MRGKKFFNLREVIGRELLTYYRRVVGYTLKTRGESVSPTNNKFIKEEKRVRKELLKRLGGISFLVFKDCARNVRVIGPFASEKDQEIWLTAFWDNFRIRFGAEKIREIYVHPQTLSLDNEPIDPEVLVRVMLRDDGEHIVV